MARECYRLAPAGSKVTFFDPASSFLGYSSRDSAVGKMAEVTGNRSRFRVEMSVALPPFGRTTQFCQHAFHRSVLLAAFLCGPMFPLDMPREFLIPQSLTKNSCIHSSFHCHFLRGYLSHFVMSSVPHADPSHRIASSGLEFCSEDNADVGFMISLMPTKSGAKKIPELNRSQAISVPANLDPKARLLV